MAAEPGAMGFIIRAKLLDQCPKLGSMVGFHQMAHLMDGHIAGHLPGRKAQAPGKIDISPPPMATAPPGFCVFEGEALDLFAQKGRMPLTHLFKKNGRVLFDALNQHLLLLLGRWRADGKLIPLLPTMPPLAFLIPHMQGLIQ